MGLDKRQKILLPLITVALAYIGWNVYSLISSPTRESSSSSEIRSESASPPSSPPSLSSQETMSGKAETCQEGASSELSAQQNEYLKLVEAYQLAKMRRLVAEEAAATLAAEEKIAEFGMHLEKSANSTLTFSSQLGLSSPTTGYELVYLGSHNDTLVATISKEGQLIEVTSNSVLPEGEKVLSISEYGLTFKKEDKTYLLDFSGLHTIPAASTPSKSVKAATKEERPSRANSLSTLSSTHLNSKGYSEPAESVDQTSAPVKTEAKSELSLVAEPSSLSFPPASDQETSLPPVPLKKEVNSTLLITKPVPEVTTATGEATTVPGKKSPDVELTAQEADSFAQLEQLIAEKKLERPAQYTQDEKFLLSIPKNHYTIQLMGSRDAKEMQRFIKENHLGNQAHYFHSYYLNHPWYVLVYGDYFSFQVAAQALDALPTALQLLKPWVRPMTSVHQAIKLYR